MAQAKDFHVLGHDDQPGTDVSVNLSMSPGRGGGSIEEPGVVMELVLAKGMVYIKADEKSWLELTNSQATAELVANRFHDNVAAALDHQPGGFRDRRKAIGAVLDYVGLGAGRDRLGAELNACERRLLEIARCLVGRPKLLMMDEPGAGLAASESDHLRKVIAGVPDFSGARVLLVDHDVELISAVCQSTLVLDFGQKIAFGPTAEVLADRRVRAAYLGVVEGAAA